jgi:hypothetical protein
MGERDEIEMTRRLARAIETRLRSVVVYGPGAVENTGDLYLLIVVSDVDPDTLRRLSSPVRWWLDRGRPWPRVLSPELLEAATDVFPIEIVDIAARHRIVYGTDPLAELVIDRADLRLQIERELREKLMRLREGYIEYWRRPKQIAELLAGSYASFVRVFRAWLHLIEAPMARSDDEVMSTIAAWLDLWPRAFEDVAQLVRGEPVRDVDAVFVSYYRALSAAEAFIDRRLPRGERSEREGERSL